MPPKNLLCRREEGAQNGRHTADGHGLEDDLARAFHQGIENSFAAKEHGAGAAAICSLQAAADAGLTVLRENVQNAENNRTRFIIISRSLYISSEAQKISLCFSLPHRTGSLYSILARFAAAGLNLTKIESRPIAGRDFEYDFYLDFTGSIHEKKVAQLLCALSAELPRFSFLGNYCEKE